MPGRPKQINRPGGLICVTCPHLKKQHWDGRKNCKRCACPKFVRPAA